MTEPPQSDQPSDQSSEQPAQPGDWSPPQQPAEPSPWSAPQLPTNPPPYSPPPTGGYPPPSGGYPPPSGGYPPPAGGYSSPSGYEPPQQPGYAPPPPTAPQQPYGQQPYAPGPYQTGQPQQGGWDYLGAPPPAPAPHGGRGRLIASVVAVVALVVGGVATYVAVSQSSSSNGASSPQQAIRNLIGDINRSDLLGVLGDLAPGERTALVGPITDDINALKRTNVLTGSADPHSVAGVQIHISNLQLSSSTLPIANDVAVVEVGGGTVEVNADLSKVPFTHAFLNAVFPNGLPANSKSHQTIDLTQQIRATGKTGRIATQKVNGRWYPSFFYSMAYDANNDQAPSPSDYIAPRGASTPDEAVQQFVNDLLAGDVPAAIALASPDELAALHTYGGIVVRHTHYGPLDTHIDAMTFNSTDIAGGKRMTLHSITSVTHGEKTTVTVDGSCVTTTTATSTKRECPDDVVTEVLNALKAFLDVKEPTPAQRAALRDLVSGFTTVGIDVSQTGGQWYVNPVRTTLDLSNGIYSHMQGNDLIEIIQYIRSNVGH